jgi:molecular chaperone GrpE
MTEKPTDGPEQGAADEPDAGIVVEVEQDLPEGDAAAARLAKLEADCATLDREKKELWERLVRTTADLENFRKRTRREIDDAKLEARARVLKEMLPVIDNLERAVAHAETGVPAAAVVDGVKLVLRQFAQALERGEVMPIEADGQPFDPAVHEAISQIETAEHPPGTVVQVYQRGYKIGDRLLRPALVVVAKAKSNEHHGPNGKDPSTDGSGGGSGSAQEG